eukprot:265471-Chlamydomonas_euryale.AAC.1
MYLPPRSLTAPQEFGNSSKPDGGLGEAFAAALTGEGHGEEEAGKLETVVRISGNKDDDEARHASGGGGDGASSGGGGSGSAGGGGAGTERRDDPPNDGMESVERAVDRIIGKCTQRSVSVTGWQACVHSNL